MFLANATCLIEAAADFNRNPYQLATVKPSH